MICREIRTTNRLRSSDSREKKEGRVRLISSRTANPPSDTIALVLQALASLSGSLSAVFCVSVRTGAALKHPASILVTSSLAPGSVK
jgi:hypothetical protein